MILLWSCLAVPPTCDALCDVAAPALADCLEAEGVGWSAAGYQGEDDFREACRTWAIEMSLLERDAVRRGSLDERGALATACEERAASTTASCSDWLALDWDRPLWEAQ